MTLDTITLKNITQLLSTNAEKTRDICDVLLPDIIKHHRMVNGSVYRKSLSDNTSVSIVVSDGTGILETGQSSDIILDIALTFQFEYSNANNDRPINYDLLIPVSNSLSTQEIDSEEKLSNIIGNTLPIIDKGFSLPSTEFLYRVPGLVVTGGIPQLRVSKVITNTKLPCVEKMLDAIKGTKKSTEINKVASESVVLDRSLFTVKIVIGINSYKSKFMN